MSHFYDDPEFSYVDYWKNRGYEHESEVTAINKLLAGKRFARSVDIGGGFGRLSKLVAGYSRQTILVEPSLKQRVLAKKFLKGTNIIIKSGLSDKTRLDASSVDLAVLIRVMHHLPDANSTLVEIFRILKPGGLAIIEFANSLNLKSQISSWLTGKPILPNPIDRRRQINVRRGSIPFVNHHPISFQKALIKNGFTIEQVLSVSNFRSPVLKRFVPSKILNSLENWLQDPMGQIYFGPSIILLAKKQNL